MLVWSWVCAPDGLLPYWGQERAGQQHSHHLLWPPLCNRILGVCMDMLLTPDDA